MNAQYLELPWPPTTNKYYRNVRGMMLISKAGREYKEKVEHVWKDQVGQLVEGPVWLSVVLTPPDKRRRDLDNHCGKALLDALKGLAYEDDSQIWRLHGEWARTTGGERIYAQPGSLAIALRSM